MCRDVGREVRKVACGAGLCCMVLVGRVIWCRGVSVMYGAGVTGDKEIRVAEGPSLALPAVSHL